MLVLDKLCIEQDDFSLEADIAVPTGARVAVLGPSGAGKSTLLSAIAGFIVPTRGHLFWNGVEIKHLPPAARPVSMLFQDNNLFPHLTAWQNVGLGLRPDLRLGREARAQVDAALERVGLAGFGERLPGQLSGGQQSRVALARALLRARPLLLLDEPFSALGPALKAGMLALVAEIVAEQGATLLMVTHEPSDARAICDLAVLVAEGRANPPEPTDRLLANPPPALRDYLG